MAARLNVLHSNSDQADVVFVGTLLLGANCINLESSNIPLCSMLMS